VKRPYLLLDHSLNSNNVLEGLKIIDYLFRSVAELYCEMKGGVNILENNYRLIILQIEYETEEGNGGNMLKKWKKVFHQREF
jgi:hypothetical protein